MIEDVVSNVSWGILLFGTFYGIILCDGKATQDTLDKCGMLFIILFATVLTNACVSAGGICCRNRAGKFKSEV